MQKLTAIFCAMVIFFYFGVGVTFSTLKIMKTMYEMIVKQW